MHRRTFLQTAVGAAAAGLASGLPMAPGALAAPAVGTAAPDFTGVDSNGKTVRLSDLRGKVVVLEWTNHDCPYVRKHYNAGNMQALQREAADQDVVWLTIASNAPGEQGHVTAGQANDLTKTRKASPAAVVLDPEGKIGRAYRAQVTPHMYVIDGKGVLQYMGAIDDKPSSNPSTVQSATNYVRPAVAAAKDGKAADPSVTRAYGCTIKLAPLPS